MKKIIENIYSKAFPLVPKLKRELSDVKAKLRMAEITISEKNHIISCEQQERSSLEKRLYRARKMNERQLDQIDRLQKEKRDNERRISKARQALFGILDQPKITGGP